MQLHQIQLEHPRKYRKPRVGRGGKRGTTAGHGTKGQKSRAGRRMRPAERDLIQRTPKLRGFKNKPLRAAFRAVNVGDLEKMAGNHKALTNEIFPGIKILGSGEIKKALEIKGIPVSQSAKKKIEAAGGRIS